jgi:hypothetical protein
MMRSASLRGVVRFSALEIVVSRSSGVDSGFLELAGCGEGACATFEPRTSLPSTCGIAGLR